MSESSHDTFAVEWNALPRSDRSRLRRLVRMGGGIDDPELEHLAAPYARYQLQRPWMRFFWLWFVPAIFLAVGAARDVHPIVLGAVIALGAQAVWAYLSLRKVARRAT